MTDPSSPNAGIGRRAVLRTAAWSMPVVALAVAAPVAAAATQPPPPPPAGTAVITVSPGGMSWLQTGDQYRGVYGNVNMQKSWSADPTAVVRTMTVTLVLPANLQLSVADGDFVVMPSSGTGWTAQSASVRPSGEFQYIYTYSSTSGLGPGYANTQLYYELKSTYTGTDVPTAFAPRSVAGVVMSPDIVASVSFTDS